MESSEPKEPRIRVEAPSGQMPEIPKEEPAGVPRVHVFLLSLGLLLAAGSLALAVLTLFE